MATPDESGIVPLPDPEATQPGYPLYHRRWKARQQAQRWLWAAMASTGYSGARLQRKQAAYGLVLTLLMGGDLREGDLDIIREAWTAARQV